MKAFKKIMAIFSLVAVFLASFIPVAAITFDAEKAYNSVFVVYSGNSLGSGFAMGENCIITNAHVISDRGHVKITTYSGETHRAFVVLMNEKLDIALLGVEGITYEPLKIADMDQISIGDDVYAIGAPNSLAYTLTKGVVSSKDRYVSGLRYIQTDAAINSGNSGGPLLNEAGEVIGINSYKMSNSEGIGLAIPIDVVVAFLESGELVINENGNVANPVTEETLPDPSQMDSNDAKEKLGNSLLVAALIIGLVLSVILNIALIVMLATYKKRNQCPKGNPSERTDFEIEIMD